MCGIAGFIGKGEISDLKRMTDAIEYRGPDDQGHWSDNDKGVFLGFRRLAIIDIDGGHQPMWSGDGSIGIVFNGEIYNHETLRVELEKKGYVFQTHHSDTEVLINGYLEWGENLPNKLNGMWAFFIYDKRKKICFGSRDRFGKKPFFYTKMNGSFVFCSELRALAQHSSAETSVSERSLMKYFAYGYIPAPNSIYHNIFKLPGGHSIFIDIESLNIKISKYWEFVLEPTESIPNNPEEEWGEQIRHLLSESVKRRLMSDVPLGIFLSGGIDSSALTYFANQALGEEKLKTFSIGFSEASFDETMYSSKVAELFQTEHYHETLSIDKALELLPEITSKLDEPMGDSSLLPTYLLSMITRKNVTVSLGGDAGDELFAGYDPFAALKKAELYSKLIPKPIHEGIRSLAGMLSTSHSNMSLDFKIKRTLRGLSYPKKFWNNIWLGPLAPNEISELFSKNVEMEDLYSEVVDYWDMCKQTSIIDKTLFLYTKLYLQDDILVKVDRASMMNSLEVRAPFLDIELVDLIRTIPHQYKYRNGERKYILKKALEPVLPKDILYRKKKGFGIPLGKWFFEGKLNVDLNSDSNTLNNGFLKKQYGDHKAGKADNRAFLWNYWLLQNMNIS